MDNCNKERGDDLLLVVFEEKLQVSTSWIHRNLYDLGGRIGITHELIKFHRIRMRVVKVKGTHWTLELFQNRQGWTVIDHLEREKQDIYVFALKVTRTTHRHDGENARFMSLFRYASVSGT